MCVCPLGFYGANSEPGSSRGWKTLSKRGWDMSGGDNLIQVTGFLAVFGRLLKLHNRTLQRGRISRMGRLGVQRVNEERTDRSRCIGECPEGVDSSQDTTRCTYSAFPGSSAFRHEPRRSSRKTCWLIPIRFTTRLDHFYSIRIEGHRKAAAGDDDYPTGAQTNSVRMKII